MRKFHSRGKIAPFQSSQFATGMQHCNLLYASYIFCCKKQVCWGNLVSLLTANTAHCWSVMQWNCCLAAFHSFSEPRESEKKRRRHSVHKSGSSCSAWRRAELRQFYCSPHTNWRKKLLTMPTGMLWNFNALFEKKNQAPIEVMNVVWGIYFYMAEVFYRICKAAF